MLTIEQIAKELAVSPKTVRRLVNRRYNKIPHWRAGRALRFDLDTVKRWARQ